MTEIKSLEDKLTEIEEKITNPEYTETKTIIYQNEPMSVTFKVLPQSEFNQIMKALKRTGKGKDSEAYNNKILSKTLFNPQTNELYTIEQLEKLLTPGLADKLVRASMEVSDFDLDKKGVKEYEDF